MAFSPELNQVVEQKFFSRLRTKQNNNCVVAYKADEVPDRFELFLLDEGQEKVEEKAETRVPNTAVFTFNKEDHTLGNLLSQRLLKNPAVMFAAYKVPHPLFATFELRVQTDGSMTPKEAVMKTCREVISDLSKLNDSFQTEWLGKRIVSEGEAERQQREQNNF
ncbi:rbp11-like subunits of rna polymerase [Stemphylium lycopersici]|uniref:Rbp11-like subunits of rna polymerase n=1 Tax=Stemphylium lycopersici TaxID=183478 RepID=A0A364N5X6_STELY|nr:rbp11-like subunits of rna polymerase [Stemphylium lycopersici]RAR01203.1 rbp11-like subunits of rna polymerase [Stemphylium lycopersici]RAR12735.1 rbp11-like subunits of rna polymerase [Stemphylium lycopersici]